MSSRFVLLCALGLAGSLFVGYCVYFDRKRRSDPNYKRKVLEKRRAKSTKRGVMINLKDPKAREEFLAQELMLANQKMMEGNLEESIGHLVNTVQFAPNPKIVLYNLQQTLPPPLFSILVQTLSSLAGSSRGQEESGAGASAEAEDVD